MESHVAVKSDSLRRLAGDTYDIETLDYDYS